MENRERYTFFLQLTISVFTIGRLHLYGVMHLQRREKETNRVLVWVCLIRCVWVCVCVLGTAKSRADRDRDMSCSFLIVARQLLNCNSGSDSDEPRQDRQHKGQARDVYAHPLPAPPLPLYCSALLGTFRALVALEISLLWFRVMQQVRVGQRATNVHGTNGMNKE